MGILPEISYSKCDFNEIRYTESLNVFRAVNKFLSALSTFIARFV